MRGRGWWGRCALVLVACLGGVGCESSRDRGGSLATGGDTVSPGEPGSPVPSDGTPPAPPPDDPRPPASPDAGSPAPDAGPLPPKPTVCAPTGEGPHWLQEGEPVTVTFRCGTGYTAPGLRFSVSPLPAGASLDEASGTFRWTPGKAQADVWLLTVTEHSTGETGVVKVGVADNWLAPGNVREVNPLTYTEEYGLPVFHLSFEGTLTAGGYRPVQLVYRGHRYTAEAKYRGATSSIFPKRNYTFKFDKEDPFNEPELAGGFSGRRNLVLITSFNDNSYLRPRLAFDLWNRMSPEHVQVKTYSAVLYVNGRFWGLFTVADHVDEHLMERHGLSDDGDLFKAVEADANFSRLDKNGAPKQPLELGFEKKEGTPKDGWVGAYDTLNALTAFIADSDRETFRTQWGSRLNTRDYEDWWIFNTAILGTDSGGKNAYHYYDPVTRAPWRFIPWDLDASFGQDWDTRRLGPTVLLDFSGVNRLFARMLEEPSISGPLRERYRSMLRGPLAKEEVLKLLDGYVREIHPVALRDEARWLQQYRTFERWSDRTDFTTHEQEVEYLRRWVDERWNLLERQLP
ncbi:CotH protein [Archangium gephyra]|uniref:CotH protein n=1 Tax=Archangium gephyra TaxID=48 RepID=A0AAC8Q3I2_9BACT|nr:CotH kinase family protein [Archangium gephyra]AKI99735.1 Inner spore coat protein H [Archangium gephyra]REG27733.1 CotH protein [Archangium gephyra]